MSETTLPVISLRRLIDGPDREAEITRLREVTHEVGFFYLSDHGVPTELEADIFSAIRNFFDLPIETKEKISNLDNPHYRGYARIGDEYTQGALDWREQIDYGADRAPSTEDLDTHPWRILEGPNPWPSAMPEIKYLVNEWLTTLSDVGHNLLRAWAQSLGQSPDFFAPYFSSPYPFLKLAHYPGHDGSESNQGVGAHHDPGVLTLLALEPNSTGLQVAVNEEWVDVPALPGHFVVNIGELLEAATDGYLKATAHRVLPPEPGTSRYSVPFFFSPNLDATLPSVELPAHLSSQTRGIGRDQHGHEIFDTFGRNLLKARFRAHPETTARYHSELAEFLTAGVQ